ncbi:hypothetical protein D9619_001519 [Psilocybe cf. subviscida]|uniref:Amino acid permease/ SLC12A domain-containing protein n=1 Tax=Psilocybe cf. subviscida TaxID=2480587 RepID=A0A8H5BD41_9AGAR|nr:hypothetical protein D9619_001519 [Psilocybe cf. subviscida]
MPERPANFAYQALPTTARETRADEYGPLDTEEDVDPLVATISTHEARHRKLQERHLSMIALAGMIGTGLFLSSGKALAHAGPLGCVLAFIIMGTVTASMEMSAFRPSSGGFVRHANLWLDKSSSIAIGWNFWYSMAITMPTELSAATTLLKYWNPEINQAIPISLFWMVIAIINFSPVSIYGEFEFYLACCKIALIVCFVITGAALDLGAYSGQDFIGLRYWQDPYPLFREYLAEGATGKFLGFWSAMLAAAFAFGNVQVVAMAGAETLNPRKSIPGALKKTFLRVVAFYVASIVVISLTVPANDERLYQPTGDVTHSPFIIAFSRAGLKAFPSLINGVVLSSAFSSGNSCSFLASRTLHGLAQDGHAPSAFLKLNRFGIPYVAVAASLSWGVVAYTSLNHGAFQAFLWLLSLVTTAGIVSWVIICVTYIRFWNGLRVQGIPRDDLPYKSPWQPYITYYALATNILILLFSGLDAFLPSFSWSKFWSSYFNCLFYPAFYLACKWWLKDSVIPLDAIDFHGELHLIEHDARLDAEGGDFHEPSTYDKFLNTFF